MVTVQDAQILLLGLTFVHGGAVASLEVNTACYGWSKLACSHHQLRCRDGGVFPLQAVRGFKLRNSSCSILASNCQSKETCCQHQSGDCFEDYAEDDLYDLMDLCWNQTNCAYEPTWHRRKICSRRKGYERASGYSVVDYVCIPASGIREFQSETPAIGSAVAVFHSSDSSDTHQTWHCRVESLDCSSHQTNILMVKFGLTRLCLNNSGCLYISKTFSYEQIRNFQTPFSISLLVAAGSGVTQARAVVQAPDSSDLRVTCGITGTATMPQPCSPATSSPPTTLETTQTSAAQPSSSSKVNESSSRDTSGITERNSGSPPGDSSSSAGMVAGVVVAAVLIVAVVVALVLIRFKRRGALTKSVTKMAAVFRTGHSHSPRHVTHGKAVDFGSVGSGLENPDVVPEEPASNHVYQNAAAVALSGVAGSSHDADVDYNHLGQTKKPVPSHDVTYNHLGGADDVTDYGYDHVVRGQHAPSRDVIDNVYDITRPQGASCQDESDDYDVASAVNNRRCDVIDNAYDTAKPQAASCSGEDDDYEVASAVDFQRRDVTESPYEFAESLK